MRILAFCPSILRPEKEVVESLLNQTRVEFFDILFCKDNPNDGVWTSVYLNMQLNYEKMRQVAIREGYQKVWVVESDTIPPEDALSKLLEVDAPVVTGVYVLRHGNPMPNLVRYSENTPTPGGLLSWEEVRNGGTQMEVSGGCMGCLLIDIEAIRDFSFNTGGQHAPDMDFAAHCHRNKIKQVARLDVLCGHKKPSGEILWPKDYIVN